MLRYAFIAFGASLTIGLPQQAAAQTTIIQPIATQTSYATQGCYDPDTDGPSNTAALPLCDIYLEQAAGGEQYATIDRGNITNLQPCRTGADCGPPADLTDIRPFYGNAGQTPLPATVSQPVALAPAPPPPAPVALAPAPPAPVALTPPPPVAIPPAPAAFSPIAALPTAGLGGVGFAAAGLLAVAAGVGVIALANDSDSSPTTN